jgi:GAF domain-containing protein
MTRRLTQLGPEEELIDAETFRDLYSIVARAPEGRERGRGGPARPPSSPAAAAALEGELGRCSSHEFAARLGVHLARTYASAAALLLVHHGMIEGICGDGLDDGRAALLFPAVAPSCFAGVVASGQPFRGAPRKNGLDACILRVLGRQHVQEIAVLPIAIRGRVVNLLYADNGPEALGEASVAALAAVCTQVARAYERAILERKRAEQACA